MTRPADPKKDTSRRTAVLDGATIVSRVLQLTTTELEQVAAARAASGKPAWSKREHQTIYAVVFAKHFSTFVAGALEDDFPGMKSGETPSQAVLGTKRVDINYSTPEAGLGFAISLKSVHFGEKQEGRSHFTHNMKRNDEELRVEATSHHLRQPYAVLAAVLLLPVDSFQDRTKTSSFGAWAEHLWALKGRIEPDDPPDRFELVFIATYARDGSELGFYQVGGQIPCPRKGRPSRLLNFEDFLKLVKITYYKRNARDFAFEGEEAPS